MKQNSVNEYVILSNMLGQQEKVSKKFVYFNPVYYKISTVLIRLLLLCIMIYYHCILVADILFFTI